LKNPEVSRSLRNFISKYSPKEAIIVHLGKESDATVGDTLVKLLPFYRVVSSRASI